VTTSKLGVVVLSDRAAVQSEHGAGDWDPEIGWSRLLADVVSGGREEHVRGTRQVRLAVARR
jgi:hypothetical protein